MVVKFQGCVRVTKGHGGTKVLVFEVRYLYHPSIVSLLFIHIIDAHVDNLRCRLSCLEARTVQAFESL